MKLLKYKLVSVSVIGLVLMLSSCSENETTNEATNEAINVDNTETKEETSEMDLNLEKNDFGYYEITQDVAKQMMDSSDVIILDVREESEYKEGHIENSVLLPLMEVSTSAESILPNKDETILVYCRSGNRSKQASYILADLGYSNVYEFGGINTWEYGVVK